MLNYAITDRKLFHRNDEYRRNSVVHQCERWAAEGIDFIQLREKDLSAAELVELTRRVLLAVRNVPGSRTKVLVNSRADVAAATAADGVHLTAAPGELTPNQIRTVFAAAGLRKPAVSISCHSVEDVRRASTAGVDAILFGPVFCKVVDRVEVVRGVGLEGLRAACVASGGTAVFALGGITEARFAECAGAGAVGVAGIRLFSAI